MKMPNYIHLRLRALSSANSAAFIACVQIRFGSAWLASKARELSDRRRREAEFFETILGRGEVSA